MYCEKFFLYNDAIRANTFLCLLVAVGFAYGGIEEGEE